MFWGGRECVQCQHKEGKKPEYLQHKRLPPVDEFQIRFGLVMCIQGKRKG